MNRYALFGALSFIALLAIGQAALPPSAGGGGGAGAVSAVTDGNGLTLSGGTLAMGAAGAAAAGAVTTGTQTLAGAKTLSNNVTLTTGVVASSVGDGATAVGFTLNSAALSTTGAKIASFQNNGSEKLSIDKDGKITSAISSGAFLALTSGVTTTFGTGTLSWGQSSFDLTGPELRILSSGIYLASGTVRSNSQVTMQSAVGSGTHVRVNSASTVSAAGDKLLSIQNNGSEKVAFTHFGGVRLVGMTTTARDALTGADLNAGLVIYNTTTNKLNFYNGSAWEAVTSAP